MPLMKEQNAEPIPGYRLIERLGSGGFGEVWKCEAPGGLFKAIKFVYGNLNGLEMHRAQAAEELKAIQRVKTIRHPFLLSMDRVEVISGELLIVTELADKSLFDLFQERRQAGHAGIPRAELLAYLREAAEVLDLLNFQYELQHLDVKPHNLFLVSNHVKVADFGLVSSLGANGSTGVVQLGAVTPLYASPEIFLGSISRQSDQYSLAIVYQELLTGTLPFQGKNSRQLLLQHTKAEPDLSSLPESDLPLLARALSKDPADRFPTCLDFVRALRAVVARSHATANVGAAAEPSASSQTDVDADFHGRGPALPSPVQQADTDADRALEVTPHSRPAAATPSSRHPLPTVSGKLSAYRFLQCLGASPLADLWRAQVPGGQMRLVKFIYGAAGRDSRRLEDAIVRYKHLLHPALAQGEVVQCDPGRLALVADPIEESLRERFQQCQTAGQAGIPRDELLGYLRVAAEALDYVYQQHGVQHLGLNPRNLMLESGRLVIADFGQAQLFWVPTGQPVAQRNARYAPPELFDGQVTRSCDQYSLALIYHELLTGRHPHAGKSARLSANGTVPKPDLQGLPDADRDSVARALHADPGQRWPNCTALINALELGQAEGPASPQPAHDPFSTLVKERSSVGMPKVAHTDDVDASPLGAIISQLVASAGGEVAAEQSIPAILGEEILHYRFSAGLPLGAARSKLDEFRQHWYGNLVQDDEQAYVFHVNMPTQFWRQWIGRQPGLEVQVGLARQHPLTATPIEVSVQIHPFRCVKKRGLQLLQEMGPPILENLQTVLLVNSEKRIQDRLMWPHPLQVRAVLADGSLGETIVCRGKDISLSGIGFYLPRELPTSDVTINLPATPQTPAISVPAKLVRAKRCADGWYEVGALFRLTALRKSYPELCHS